MSFNLIFKMENSKHIYKKNKKKTRKEQTVCASKWKTFAVKVLGISDLKSCRNPSVTCQRTKETSNDFYCEAKEKEEGHESFRNETRAILASTFANFDSCPQ